MLLNEHFSKDTSKLANKSLTRIKEELPLYHLYSASALHIAKKEFNKALSLSKELKDKMLSDFSFLKEKNLPAGAVLFSLNLLRIAHLEGRLNNQIAEVNALEELANYLKLNSNEKPNSNIERAANFIKESFSEKSIELSDYIKYKKSLISSK